MIVYLVILLIVFFLIFRYVKALRIEGLNDWTMSIALLFKFLIGLFFLYVYTEHYGKGTLSADAGEFIRESTILNEVFYKSPIDYFKFLFGIGNTSQLIDTHLGATTHWDAGGQMLLNDNRNVLRVHSLILFFSFKQASIHVLMMCVLSLIAAKQLFLGARKLTLIKPNYLFWILLFIPSVFFWTSGILKEPMMFLGFALLIRGIFDDLSTRKRYTLLLIGIILLIGFKPYVIVSIIPAFTFYVLYKLLPKFKIVGSLLILSTITVLALSIFSEQRQKYVHLISRKQFDFNNVAHGGLHAYADTCFYFFEPSQFKDLRIDGDSVSVKKTVTAAVLKHGEIDTPRPIVLQDDGTKWYIYFKTRQCFGYIDMTLIDDSFQQMLLNIPQALQNSLLRPFINDKGSWLKYPAVAEIWLIIIFLIYSIIKRRKLEPDQKALIIAIAIFVIILSLLIGWVTPVLGAITRYRIPSIIGIIIISLIIVNPPLKFRKHE